MITMSNYTPNTSGLDKSPGLNKPIKVYRLPEAIAPKALEYAHKLDQGNYDSKVELDTAIDTLIHALTLPTNTGGTIKREIRNALDKLAELQRS
jgi:hypothetical protein